MEAKDTFELKLTWCRKHRNWWITNCPDCMVDSNEENIKQAGRKEVVEFMLDRLERFKIAPKLIGFTMLSEDWEEQLKEWNI